MAQLGRAQPFPPHLPRLAGRPPGPPPKIVHVGIIPPRLLRPHLASPIVSPAVVVAFIAPPPSIVRTRIIPPRLNRPHLASPNLASSPPIAPVTFYQALRRILVGRTIPRPHTAPPSLAQPPIVKLLQTVLTQAGPRAFQGRTVFAPHRASPIVTPTTRIAGLQWLDPVTGNWFTVTTSLTLAPFTPSTSPPLLNSSDTLVWQVVFPASQTASWTAGVDLHATILVTDAAGVTYTAWTIIPYQ